MPFRARLILLCEDLQHETFLRRFFRSQGWQDRGLRILRSPAGRGSGEAYVREQFVLELRAYRSKPHLAQALVVMIDGDQLGHDGRRDSLIQACITAGIDPPKPTEAVAVFVPTWRIETWLWYLDGEATDEGVRDYPRLPKERQCQRHVDALDSMCQAGRLAPPSPPSLVSACTEYQRLRTVLTD